MSTYSEFFLASKSSVAQLETLEISHPNFSKVYRIVRNATNGITITLETLEVAFFEYYPLRITKSGSRQDLDFALEIDLGDLGDVLSRELDLVAAADAFQTKPSVIYRVYRSDDLLSPIFGPIVLEMGPLSFKRDATSFRALAPSLNRNKTGELYKLERFPMLRGFL